MSHDVHGQGENDGRIFLGRNGVQRLQVAKLQLSDENFKSY